MNRFRNVSEVNHFAIQRTQAFTCDVHRCLGPVGRSICRIPEAYQKDKRLFGFVKDWVSFIFDKVQLEVQKSVDGSGHIWIIWALGRAPTVSLRRSRLPIMSSSATSRHSIED